MAKIGYARVSTTAQNLDLQLDKLKDCEKIFQEKRSALTMERPQFKKMMNFLREGDILCVTKLDRLARNIRDLMNIKKFLDDKCVKLIVIDQNIDTTTPIGNLLFGMLGVFAEFESELKKENVTDGMIIARSKGIKLGRSKKLTENEVEELKKLRNDGYTISELIEKFNASRSTIYRHLDPINEKEVFEYEHILS